MVLTIGTQKAPSEPQKYAVSVSGGRYIPFEYFKGHPRRIERFFDLIESVHDQISGASIGQLVDEQIQSTSHRVEWPANDL